MKLCYRCEHRAIFNEFGNGPRWECQQSGQAVYSCYMYKPVKPVALEINEGEKRSPFSGAMLSARCHALETQSSFELKVELLTKNAKKFCLYWVPIKRKK